MLGIQFQSNQIQSLSGVFTIERSTIETMSNQSGIIADQNLLDSLSDVKTGGIVVITAKISDDSTAVHLDKKYESLKEAANDLGSVPLYLFVKGLLDDKSQYYFASYVPDSSPVRGKMLYASTKNTLIRQIGSNSIGKQAHLTDAEQLLDLGNKKDAQDDSALTESERTDIQISQQQQRLKASTFYPGGRKLVSQTNGSSKSLSFQLASGESSIEELLKSFNVLTFKIDMDSEQIQVESKDNITSPKDLKITSEHPSYVVYRNGDLYYFIYSCPSGSKVKERMVYASNCSGFVSRLQDEHDLKFARIVEIGEPIELEHSLISCASAEEQAQEEARSKSATETKFNRPKGPARKRGHN